jgi:hypothetical protein
MAGAFTVDSGLVSLNEANTIGSVRVTGGLLAFGNTGALGAGHGRVKRRRTHRHRRRDLGNAVTFSGTSRLAAAWNDALRRRDRCD